MKKFHQFLDNSVKEGFFSFPGQFLDNSVKEGFFSFPGQFLDNSVEERFSDFRANFVTTLYTSENEFLACKPLVAYFSNLGSGLQQVRTDR